MPTLRISLIIVILLGILIVLQFRLWFEPSGIREMIQLKRKLTLEVKENAKLKKRNEELLFQVERLQKSQDTVEARARSELGMIKKDEIFYQIVKDKEKE